MANKKKTEIVSDELAQEQVVAQDAVVEAAEPQVTADVTPDTVSETQQEPKRSRKAFRNRTPKDVHADLVLNDGGTGVTLTRGEKFRRALRSQSGWLFMLPALLLMLVFTFYPIVSAFINAFRENYRAIYQNSTTGWGFENFKVVLTSAPGGASFVQCLINTLVLTLVSVPLSTLLALLISVALNSIKAVQKAYQTILFLPYLTNALAMGAVFATFFNIVGTQAQLAAGQGTYGLVNAILGTKIDWIGAPTPETAWTIGSVTIPWANYIVAIIYEVWSGLPFKILILFSALQSINKQYYDAAKVDGASRSTIMWRITAPMVSPQISYLLVTGIMGGMKQYSAVVGIFGEDMGFNYSMGTVVGFLYKYLGDGWTGYAYAGSLLLFVIIMIMTWINNMVTKKHTTYR